MKPYASELSNCEPTALAAGLGFSTFFHIRPDASAFGSDNP